MLSANNTETRTLEPSFLTALNHAYKSCDKNRNEYQETCP